MKKRNEEFHNDPWDRDFYETGSTRPPKNHGGLVAFLLVLAIFLGGLTTFLGVLNIRLFRMLTIAQEEKRGEEIQMVQWNSTADTTEPTESTMSQQQEHTDVMGMECVTVSNFDRRYYRLPQGCLVMEVEENSLAGQAGFCSGDVILSLNGRAVQSTEELLSVLDQSGGEIRFVVYRSHTNQKITIEMED